MTGSHDDPLPLKPLTERVIGVFYSVYRELGFGFSEAVYRRAMAVALRDEGLQAFESVWIDVAFRRRIIGRFCADLVVDGVLILELKATEDIDRYAECQILNYLKAAGGGVGLVLNFGRTPRFKRMVMGDPHDSLPALRKHQPR
ncbi:MAG TPA: GxxExxY protein [Vicinamibacterales bacterium]|nr:GxxExxY protein [Vicinamibacterales bacterium]